MTTLAATVDARLQAAGFKPSDPALRQLRAWNRAAAEQQTIRVELRRGQFGSTRLVRLDDVDTAITPATDPIPVVSVAGSVPGLTPRAGTLTGSGAAEDHRLSHRPGSGTPEDAR